MRQMCKENRAALQTAFAEDHSRHEREVRKVSLEEEFVGRESLRAMDCRVGLLQDFVDQEHRFTMGNHGLDLSSGQDCHVW
jgi:hypothetical protein